MQRAHPNAAARTATPKRLARDLPGAPGATMAERVAALDLAAAPVERWEDVDDPAGGEVEVFVACAREVLELVGGLAAVIEATRGDEPDAGIG